MVFRGPFQFWGLYDSWSNQQSIWSETKIFIMLVLLIIDFQLNNKHIYINNIYSQALELEVVTVFPIVWKRNFLPAHCRNLNENESLKLLTLTSYSRTSGIIKDVLMSPIIFSSIQNNFYFLFFYDNILRLSRNSGHYSSQYFPQRICGNLFFTKEKLFCNWCWIENIV